LIFHLIFPALSSRPEWLAFAPREGRPRNGGIAAMLNQITLSMEPASSARPRF